jgi:hypothetical protein
MQTELLCQALAAGAESVRQLVEGVTPEEARLRPQPGSWSILEVVCHLYDEEREDFRYRLDVMLHRPSEAWPRNDPEGWVVARRYREQNLAERLEAFWAERRQSLAWLAGLEAPNWDATFPAPWGPMKAGDMLAAWVTHDCLTLRQLVELRYAWLGRVVAPYQGGYAGDW